MYKKSVEHLKIPTHKQVFEESRHVSAYTSDEIG